METKRASWASNLGFLMAAIGSAVGLGNIWRFPYLAAKYGGGIFLLIYILLAVTFGYTMIMAETALGRMTRKSPVGAFAASGKGRWRAFGGWINAVIPILIVPYYSVIGGWVIKYLVGYITGHGSELAQDGYFSSFIANGVSVEIVFLLFTLLTLGIIFAGVRNGVERVSRMMMPVLVVLSVIIAAYSVTRPGALEGVKYFLVPNPANFSWMTVVTAMGQMFYSLSIAMGILVTFGSYMKKDVSIEGSTKNVEIFDTLIAMMAGLMIIPAVFSFSGGDPDTLQAGPALMFITIPKVFESMELGSLVGVLFFVLVLFAAVTSSIALTESAVSTFEDELGWSRKKAAAVIGIIMLGSLSALGYGPLSGVTVIGMQFLDFFDFLTNSVMMPIAAIATCLLVTSVIGVEKIEEEVTQNGQPFRRKKVFNFMIRTLCPVFAAIILVSSVANALGWISM
jgi:NSS family neurotransmitter:Na+ symporter